MRADRVAVPGPQAHGDIHRQVVRADVIHAHAGAHEGTVQVQPPPDQLRSHAVLLGYDSDHVFTGSQFTMPSFDVVSELEAFEVNHAVQNTTKEIATRFDFRGADVKVEFNEKNKEIKLSAEADFQVDQARAMLENHLIKRKVDPQVLDPQKIEPSGKLVHQVIKLKDGLDSDTAKKIVKLLKENGYKVQASIQGDKVRVTDKKRDALQDVMAFLRQQQLGLPLQFNNFKD
ncbi:UNVERIFIED_CONTAM: UPF0234 protein [Trichonephila clavipes]